MVGKGIHRCHEKLTSSHSICRWCVMYFSARVKGSPLMASSASPSKIMRWASLPCFNKAVSFHNRRTACRGVTKAALSQGGDVQSVVGAPFFVKTKRQSMSTCFCFAFPNRRWLRKFCHSGFVTRICSVRETTIVNCSNMTRSAWLSSGWFLTVLLTPAST